MKKLIMIQDEYGASKTIDVANIWLFGKTQLVERPGTKALHYIVSVLLAFIGIHWMFTGWSLFFVISALIVSLVNWVMAGKIKKIEAIYIITKDKAVTIGNGTPEQLDATLEIIERLSKELISETLRGNKG